MIHLSDVGKSFRRRGRRVDALAGVDLDVAEGEFVSLVGPSGCGKSTLLRLIGGLLMPDTGSIEIDGASADDARRRRQFGLVPQSPSLAPWTTVAGNVTFLSRLQPPAGAPRPPADQAAELLDQVGLGAFAGAYPHELSGGMQQRVALVRAFALGAPILLMDEPFAALDEITRADMRYLLADLLVDRPTTVVFVTHSVAEAVVLSDRVAVMAPRPGHIVATRAIELDRPRTPDIEDTTEFHDLVSELRAELRRGLAA